MRWFPLLLHPLVGYALLVPAVMLALAVPDASPALRPLAGFGVVLAAAASLCCILHPRAKSFRIDARGFTLSRWNLLPSMRRVAWSAVDHLELRFMGRRSVRHVLVAQLADGKRIPLLCDDWRTVERLAAKMHSWQPARLLAGPAVLVKDVMDRPVRPSAPRITVRRPPRPRRAPTSIRPAAIRAAVVRARPARQARHPVVAVTAVPRKRHLKSQRRTSLKA